ncbi:uncharacterized protein LOC126233443 [Schistocerca nitens]|uniref:uncharacterized protein LOC126233443 n=1 Tax=Schistocerca nitens TaxID=7011 RepID=UPI002118AA0E|nr:uncharacterized protein LOC126233443 [Schistocerca nitens]
MYKLFIKCVDNIKLHSLLQIYASDENMFGYHTYWHAEMSREVMLIAHGSGEVGIFDQREGKLSYMYKCHYGTVRTVQCHPTVEYYFATGSGHGEARIWDIRDSKKLTPEPVVDLRHPKILTGCFFSPAGNYLITTCTNGRLTVYDTRSFRSQIPKDCDSKVLGPPIKVASSSNVYDYFSIESLFRATHF